MSKNNITIKWHQIYNLNKMDKLQRNSKKRIRKWLSGTCRLIEHMLILKEKHYGKTTYQLSNPDKLDIPRRSSKKLYRQDQMVANAWLETLFYVIIELLPTEILNRKILQVAISKGQLSQNRLIHVLLVININLNLVLMLCFVLFLVFFSFVLPINSRIICYIKVIFIIFIFIWHSNDGKIHYLWSFQKVYKICES